MNHVAILGAAALLIVVASSCTAVRRESSAAPGRATVGAEGYYRWLAGCLDAIEGDLPAIADVADRAAAAYVQDGWEIGALGDRGMVGEFNSRAGGMMRTSRPKALQEDDWQGIVLVFPRGDARDEDLAAAGRLAGQGRMVILFGGAAYRAEADKAGVRYDAFVDTHAAATGGLFAAADGSWVVPTDPPAAIAALWTWAGEFVAALTRRGKMPPMYQSIMVPGAAERNGPQQGLKFCEHEPQPVAAGVLGRVYLSELRRSLNAVHEREMGRIADVAARAVAAKRAGHTAHVFAHGHAIRDHVQVAHDPGLLRQVNRGLFELRDDLGIAPGDFVFCVGYDRIFEGWYFKDATTRMRAAGAALAWSMTDYSTDPDFGPAAVPAGEIVVGQHWALGDAVVEVPGYDVKILPPSGVVAEAVLFMVEAEVLAQLGAASTTAP
ncbi:MAG: hypothetical protein JXL80_14770 [Planctomycetes bacterium]|nr:hypothetical protein [Planctomycetota bacterium]